MWAKRSLQCSRAPHVGWLLLVLLAAAAPRFLWYRTHHPWLPPDSYGYLNVAREWRGEPVPLGVWDDRSQLPADNQAARTPGYPLFLNLVFALTGHAPTPDASLADARHVLIPGVGTGARAVHLRHLNTDENVRAVQAVQHGVGVVAAGLAFLIAYRWTSRASAAAVAAIVGVAWNPVLIVTLEPQVMAETLAGTLLIAIIWLLTRQTRTSDGLAAALCGVSVVVRPAMLFAALPILVYLLWNNRRHLFDATVLLALPLLLLTLLAANNGLRYGYWGISSIGGATLLTHAAAHADALDEPARSIAAPFRPYFPSGFVVVQRVASLRGTSYFEAVRIVNAIAVQYVLRHPRWYLESVGESLLDFFSPPLRYIPGQTNVFRTRFPRAWMVLSGVAELVFIAGLAAFSMRVAGTMKLGAAMFAVSGVATSMTSHLENPRFAAPLVPIVMMSGVAVMYFAMRDSLNRWRTRPAGVSGAGGDRPADRGRGDCRCAAPEGRTLDRPVDKTFNM